MINVLNYQFLESVSRRSLLGIRFWDSALNAQIHSGLIAVLHPYENSRKKVYASCTRSGIYVFNSIPGMLDAETQQDDQTQASSPPETQQYVLEVHDPKGRFTSVAVLVTLPLPYNGLYLVDNDLGSPANAVRGFNLYSSITRAASSQYAFVRGDLLIRDTEGPEPAAHAVVKVDTEDGLSWFGISDKNGKFAVMMPYPFLDISFGSSPPTSDGVRLFQRNWVVTISVQYEPLAQLRLPGSELPDYLSVLNQQQANIYEDLEEEDEVDMAVRLEYGRDLILRTEGFSELYISPIGSPA